MVAAKIATLGHGGDRSKASIEALSQGSAGQLLNVSEASVERAKAVQRRGSPELVSAVERGRVSVSAAADVATLPKEEQRTIVARGEREILEKAAEKFGISPRAVQDGVTVIKHGTAS